MIHNFDYHNFRFQMGVAKIKEEIEFYQNTQYEILPINEYIAYLKNRIGADRPEFATMTAYDRSGNRYELKKMNLDEYAKDIDMMTFNRPWTKLREFHKIMKIKEFVDSLKYGKNATIKSVEKNKNYLKNELCKGLKTKRFVKNKSVIEYQQEVMKIKSISSVIFNKKTGLYEIDWDC